MKKSFVLSLITLLTISPLTNLFSNEPDSAYIFAYGTSKSKGQNGLHFAWSMDKENWHQIGPEHSYVRSDYGRWGSQKRMLTPYLYQDTSGIWHCVFSLNEQDGTFAHVASDDLVYWKRQSYPIVMQNQNCQLPEISNLDKNQFLITWISSDNKAYSTTTQNFKDYTSTQSSSDANRINNRRNEVIAANSELGTVHKVAWSVIDGLIKAQQFSTYKRSLWDELAKDDSERFKNLKSLEANITIQPEKSKKISDLLIGIFFEDISYAADGGLYAELIQNRDFEYALSDKEGWDKSWNSYKAWSVSNENATFTVDTILPIHPNNRHYAVLDVKETGVALTNEGWGGIAVKAGEKYDFSIFARTLEGKNKNLNIRLTGKNGEVYGTAATKNISSEWRKYDVVITAKETATNAKLEIIPQSTGKMAFDMISLFPQKTFKGRKNGLRADLAQTIADLKPRFVRFPGGCVAHGDGLGNMYRWKNTIGALESRVPQRNLWGYHQTGGLGYFEYFQFCEDIDAEPIPIVAAGVPCQNSATGGAGQQCGIPMHEMHDYIQEIFDLIEYANGDIKTKWGKKRAEAGHPKPFNLKYIGVGNEDLITDIFEERFTMIFNAVKEKYPEITVIGTVGPFCEGTDYVEGWGVATKLNIPIVDEHYYQTPGWFINNQDFYDRYDRTKSKVYLGEYAAHVPGRHNNIETALAEALYLTSIERNGDIVSMTSYAPLLAKEGHVNWSPDLIYFNNTEVKPTVGYYVQKLYGENAGDEYLPNFISINTNQESAKKRIACSVVRHTKSGDVIIKLVNMLPIEVKTEIDINKLELKPTITTKTVLQGKPDDRNAKPVVSNCSIEEINNMKLPAYSFTVIRIKK